MVILCLSALLQSSCDNNPMEAEEQSCRQISATIEGHVQDGVTEEPISGVSISTVPVSEQTTTNASGDYRIPVQFDTCKNKYTVKASAPGKGYKDNTAEVELTEGNPTKGNIQLFKRPLLQVSPTQLDFLDNRNSLAFIIRNDGGGEFTYEVNEPDETWISVEDSDRTGLIMDNSMSVNVNVNRSGLCNGDYTNSLTVTTDHDAGSEIVYIRMEIRNAGCSRPEADFIVTPTSGTTQTSFCVNATSASDAEDPLSNLEVQWRWEGGTEFTAWTIEKQACHVYHTDGTKTITLRVRDTQGGIGEATKAVMVVLENGPPTASFSISPQSGDTETNFTVDGSASMDDQDLGAALQVRWQWDEGALFSEWQYNKVASHRYSSGGNKKITLQVKDSEGLVGETSKIISVTHINQPPVAAFSINPATGDTQTRFVVDASSSSDPENGNQLDFRWQWNTNENFTDWSRENSTAHIYPVGGEKHITLEVRDAEGEVATFSRMLTVEQGEAEPNDVLSESTFLDVNQSIEARIGPADDAADWYQIQTVVNGHLEVRIRNLNPAQIGNGQIGKVRIYNATEHALGTLNQDRYANTDTNLEPGESLKKTVSLSGGQTYYVVVYRYNSVNTAPYRLELTYTEETTEDIGEPNYSINTAYEVDATGSYAAWVGQVDNEDYYKVIAPGNGSLEVRLSNLYRSEQGIGNGRLGEVRILDAAENILGRLNRYRYGGPDTNLEPGESLKTTAGVASAAVYYIVVYRYGIEHAAPYRLETRFE